MLFDETPDKSTGSLGGGIENMYRWFGFRKLIKNSLLFHTVQKSAVIMFKGNVFSLGTEGVCYEFLETCIN